LRVSRSGNSHVADDGVVTITNGLLSNSASAPARVLFKLKKDDN
jgi:hypothetical protein